MTTPALHGAAATAKRRAEKASTDIGPPPKLKWIAVDKLAVDHRYQRELGDKNRGHINRIVREFNWLFYQPICVAPAVTGGGYLVIDGQHRLEAAKKHPLVDELPCYVVEAPDVRMQAKAFVALNARRIGITRLHRFWAAEAGGDPTARRIAALCAKAGVTIVRSAQRLPPKATYATTTFEKLLPLGDPAISAGLSILAEAQGEAEDAFKASNIAAVVRIVAEMGRALHRPTFVSMLADLDLDDEIGRARVHRAREGGTIEAALQRLLRKRYDRAIERRNQP